MVSSGFHTPTDVTMGVGKAGGVVGPGNAVQSGGGGAMVKLPVVVPPATLDPCITSSKCHTNVCAETAAVVGVVCAAADMAGESSGGNAETRAGLLLPGANVEAAEATILGGGD